MELKPQFGNGAAVRTLLLIVPYGIETLPQPHEGTHDGLLIVPYGIETHCLWLPALPY